MWKKIIRIVPTVKTFLWFFRLKIGVYFVGLVHLFIGLFLTASIFFRMEYSENDESQLPGFEATLVNLCVHVLTGLFGFMLLACVYKKAPGFIKKCVILQFFPIIMTAASIVIQLISLGYNLLTRKDVGSFVESLILLNVDFGENCLFFLCFHLIFCLSAMCLYSLVIVNSYLKQVKKKLDGVKSQASSMA